MKKYIISFLIIIIFISISCSRQDILNRNHAMITFLMGNVTKNGNIAEMGDLINEDDIVRTSVGAFCDIKIGNSIIRIKQKSKVIISQLVKLKNEESTEVGLSVGKMLCKPKKLLKSEKFLIKTPTAVAGVRGTNFSVEVDKKQTTRIKVYNGKVKVAKRIEQLDNNSDIVLNASNSLRQNEKVIITKKESDRAGKNFAKLYKRNSGKYDDREKLIASIVKKTKSEITISRKSIQKFTASDLLKDKNEMIGIKVRSGDVVKKLSDYLRKEKKSPMSKGRLLVTRYDVYYIKNGEIAWEGKIANSPINRFDKLYVLSGDYIFCADPDGPIYWKQKVRNDGKIQFKGRNLTVKSNGRELKFDPDTGRRL